MRETARVSLTYVLSDECYRDIGLAVNRVRCVVTHLWVQCNGFGRISRVKEKACITSKAMGTGIYLLAHLFMRADQSIVTPLLGREVIMQVGGRPQQTCRKQAICSDVRGDVIQKQKSSPVIMHRASCAGSTGMQPASDP